MSDFRVYQRTLIHRWIKILLFLGIFLIPLYSILDYFTVPEGLFFPFLIARLTASALLIAITLVVHFSPVSAIDHLYGYLFTIVVGGVIAWMTVKLGGFDSGYYAGLNLVVIAVNLVVPWKYVHTIANALLVLIMYIALNLLTPQPFQWTILINNLYFLTSTALIVSVISWLRYDLVKKEYDSRQKADASQTEEIAELARAAERLSSGDFTVNLDLEFSSTAGTLLSAFQKMREDLKNALRQISLASHNVEGYARQIMDHTHLMAEGTEKQSAQAEESVETIKALANQIRENAEEATRLFHTAEAGEKRALAGREGVAEAVRGMKSIDTIVSGLATKVQNLELSSRRIGDIIKAIIEIADQTNMLALNASIEAARAGEQGRGFAVVAEEVGKLADRTTHATRETNSIIQAIQNDIQAAIGAMETGSSEIQKTIGSVEKVSSLAQEVSEFTTNLIGAVRDIAETGRNQARSSEGINSSIEEIRTLTTSTSKSIHGVASAAEELHKITEDLKQLVSGFRINGN